VSTNAISALALVASVNSVNLLEYVQTFKYLCHMITNTLSDDDDIKREIRKVY